FNILMKCKLCQEKSASKIKSHFISKFLGKDLFEDGYTFQIKNDYTKKKIFDIPKDSFIFCEECENKFSLIETISSRILSNIDKQDNYNNLFNINYNFGNLILTLNRETKVFKDRKSTRLNSSHVKISYAVFCLKKK